MKSTFIQLTLAANFIFTSAFAGPPALGQQNFSAVTKIQVQNSSQQLSVVKEYDSYLQQLGLENYSARAQYTLENESVDDTVKAVLQQNIKDYEIVNAARNITTFIMSRTIPQMTQGQSSPRAQEIQSKLVKLAGQFLDLRPLEGFSEIPVEIETIPAKPEQADQKKSGEIKKSLLTKHANVEAMKNANFHKNQIISNIMDTIYGTKNVEAILTSGKDFEREQFQQEIDYLETWVKKYIHATYENKNLGTTKWLGKGLIYSLVRFSRIQNDKNDFGADTETKLASHLRETYAENLNNYVTAKITTVDANGKSVEMNVETGNVLNESSKEGKDSLKKASAIFPKFLKNPKAYMRMMLKGMWVFPGFYFMTSDTAAVKEKMETDTPVNISDRFKHLLDQTKLVLAYSFTSAAIAVVKEAETIPGKPETKVQAVMAVESSPNDSIGGVRWVGLEGYGFMNPAYASFAITKFDVKKMQAVGRKQFAAQKNPYQIWEGDDYTWSAQNEKFLKRGNNKTTLTLEQKDQSEIYNMLMNMSSSEYKKAFQQRLEKVLQAWTYGKDAKAYAYNYIDSTSAFYSSLMARLAIRVAGYVDPSLPSRFSVMHTSLKKTGSKTLAEINTDKALTAPNFAAINTELIENSSSFKKDGLTKFIQPRGLISNEFEERLLQHSAHAESFSTRLEQMLANSMRQNFTIRNPNDQFPSRAEAYIGTYEYGQTVRTLQGSKLFSEFSVYATKGDQSTAKTNSSNNGSTLQIENKIAPESVVRSDKNWESQLRTFFFDYGFDDKAAQVRAEIKRNPVAQNRLARYQQLENIRSFEGNNAARELAILLFSRTKDRLKDPTQLNLINGLIAKALSLQPKNENILLSSELLAKLKKMPDQTEEDFDKILEVKKEYLKPALKRSVDETTRIMTAEFLGVIYGDQVGDYLNPSSTTLLQAEVRERIQQDATSIFKMMSIFVDRMYFDTQTGATRWLGRALLLGLARLAEQAEPNVHYLKTEPLLNLQKHLLNYSLDIEMFIGNKVVVLDNNMKFEKIPVSSGDGTGYMSNNSEAGAIAYGSQAGDSKRAKRLGMTGTLLDSATFVNEEKIIEDGFTLRRRFWKASNRGGFGSMLLGKEKKGNSHYGEFVVLGPDEFNFRPLKTNSKIEVVYVIDNFPNPVADTGKSMARPGGVRFTGPETFNDAAHDSHITISQINHAKRGEMLLAQINKKLAEGTYLKPKGAIVFPGHRVVLDENEKIVLPAKKADGNFVEPTSGWQINMDLNEVVVKKKQIESRLAAARSESEKNKLYTELSFWLQARTELQYDYMMSIGTFFKWVTPEGIYVDFATYCSQLPNVAFKMANNLEIEIIPSASPGLKKAFAKLGQYAEENINKASGAEKKYLQKILDFDLVDTALKLSKLFIVYAPSSMLLQPYHDDAGIHKVQLVSSGLGNILNTTSNELFIRKPEVLEGLDAYLKSKQLVALKDIDSLDLIGVVEHYLHKSAIYRADRGVENIKQMIQRKDQQREILDKKEETAKKRIWDRFRKKSSQGNNINPTDFKSVS